MCLKRGTRLDAIGVGVVRFSDLEMTFEDEMWETRAEKLGGRIVARK